MSCQQVTTWRNETAKARAANVSQAGPVIPQVAFCLVSDSLRKGSNLIVAGSTQRGEPDCRDGCSGETTHLAYLQRDNCFDNGSRLTRYRNKILFMARRYSGFYGCLVLNLKDRFFNLKISNSIQHVICE